MSVGTVVALVLFGAISSLIMRLAYLEVFRRIERRRRGKNDDEKTPVEPARALKKPEHSP